MASPADTHTDVNRLTQIVVLVNYNVCSVCICVTVAERINTQLASRDTGRLFAVVHVAGKQRKITAEDVLVVDKPLEADIGQRIRLNKVAHEWLLMLRNCTDLLSDVLSTLVSVLVVASLS